LFFAESQLVEMLLMGENSLKWRLQSQRSSKIFSTLFDKVIQFLASNNSKKSLVVEHERFTTQEPIEITAQFLSKKL
jgi:lipid-A-disaccharide synthase-like uncharacterized protein